MINLDAFYRPLIQAAAQDNPITTLSGVYRADTLPLETTGTVLPAFVLLTNITSQILFEKTAIPCLMHGIKDKGISITLESSQPNSTVSKELALYLAYDATLQILEENERDLRPAEDGILHLIEYLDESNAIDIKTAANIRKNTLRKVLVSRELSVSQKLANTF